MITVAEFDKHRPTVVSCVRMLDSPYEGAVVVTNWESVGQPPYEGAELRVDAGLLYWHDGRSLDEVKAAKREQINQWRIAATRSGFTFDDRLVSTDELGRSDIDGTNGTVTLTGDFPLGWPGYWKAEDNTLIPITDIATWKRFYGAMSAQGATNFSTSQNLKDALTLAQTVAEVDAIVWPGAA